MPEEARDFEVLRAELDARIQELVEATGKSAATPGAEREEPPGVTHPPARFIQLDRPRPQAPTGAAEFLTLEEVERRHITAVLEARNWRVSGPKGAARVLGLNASTLRSRMKKLGITRDISQKRDI